MNMRVEDNSTNDVCVFKNVHFLIFPFFFFLCECSTLPLVFMSLNNPENHFCVSAAFIHNFFQDLKMMKKYVATFFVYSNSTFTCPIHVR